MNWLTNFVKPKLSALVGKRKDVPDNLWKNCPKCGNMIHHKDLKENLIFFFKAGIILLQRIGELCLLPWDKICQIERSE